MKRTALLALALLVASPARAEDVDIQLGGTGMNVRVRERDTVTTTTTAAVGMAIPAESYKLVYEKNPDGATLMKVLSPEGAQLQVWNGKRLVHEDDVPTTFNAAPDTFYRFLIKLADGRVWEKKLSAKRRSTGSLSLIVPEPPPQVIVREDRDDRRDRHDRHDRHDRERHHHDRPLPPPGPIAMADGDFAALKSAISSESFENQKMSVLQTAATSAHFTVSQVGQLVDLMDFSSGKVQVVEVTRPRILDLQNAFHLYSHFDFEGDKAKVRKILGQ
ncbi:MAG: DUF4476 domain-containing protein [Deltaproteobacteria bacterium]|nr:DUF4476 domain-containing protein [Deltaproteobacteria bacterium]